MTTVKAVIETTTIKTIKTIGINTSTVMTILIAMRIRIGAEISAITIRRMIGIKAVTVMMIMIAITIKI
jgi:hypothetical protein